MKYKRIDVFYSKIKANPIRIRSVPMNPKEHTLKAAGCLYSYEDILKYNGCPDGVYKKNQLHASVGNEKCIVHEN